MEATIYATDNFGESVHVTTQLAVQCLTCEGDRHLKVVMNEHMGLKIKPDQTCFFNPETGERVRC